MRDVAAMLLATVQLPGRGTVLDVGCGSGGTMAWWHANHPDWRPIGLEVSLDGLIAARPMGLALSKASALQLPHPNGSVDLIISFDVLQHLPLDEGDVLATCGDASSAEA